MHKTIIMGPLAIPLIQAGTSLLNAGSQGMQNAANRRFSEKMYNQQRADALSDRDFENFYNSPAEQMKRLEAGGLNPNLVYGNGANTATVSTRQSNYSQPQTKAPELSGIGEGIMSFFKIMQMQAETDRIKAAADLTREQTKIVPAQGENIQATTANTQANTARTGVLTNAEKLQLDTATQLQPVTIETAKATLDQKKADIANTLANTTATLDANERAKLTNAQNLQKGVEEILNLRLSRAKTEAEINHINQTIANLKNSNVLQELDIALKRVGVQPSDNIVFRVIGQALNTVDPGITIQKMINQVKSVPAGTKATEVLKRILGWNF